MRQPILCEDCDNEVDVGDLRVRIEDGLLISTCAECYAVRLAAARRRRGGLPWLFFGLCAIFVGSAAGGFVAMLLG